MICTFALTSAGAESCLDIYKKQAEENTEHYRKKQDRHVHGEVTFSGNGRTVSTNTLISNGNITFSGQETYTTEDRNDEKIALELLNDEMIMKITEGEAYEMITHLQNKFKSKNVELSIADIQAYIKKGFEDGEFCKDGKANKRAGQIIRYAKRQIKDEKINNSPRKPSPQKLADDFNTDRDVAGKKKPEATNED